MNLPDTQHCTGCGACSIICPHHALQMIQDNEGFFYPELDAKKCIACGLCESVCPVNHPSSPREPLQVFAAACADRQTRLASSSGGIFHLLASQTLCRQGVVVGAGWNADMEVEHKLATQFSELEDLQGSKYVQSFFSSVLPVVKACLEKNQHVLICGTPCQIAAVRSYLQMCLGLDERKREFLLLVDFICHGVPSSLVFRKYRNEMEKIFHATIKKISFRDKSTGWKNYSLKMTFSNGKKYQETFTNNLFMQGFLQELYNRPSCHQCAFRHLRSGSDITIADYWGVEKTFPDLQDDLGISVVFLNTEKGKESWNKIQHDLKIIRQTTFSDIAYNNSALVNSPKPHPKRNTFFKKLKKGLTTRKAIKDCLKSPLKNCVMQKSFNCIRRLKRLLAISSYRKIYSLLRCRETSTR